MIARVLHRPEADAHIRNADAWWKEDRQASPRLFIDELHETLKLLAENPDLGRPYRHREIPGLRRFLMPATRYHAYYVRLSETNEILLLAVWSAVRGRAPRMRAF